jgi:colanic acid biosynthesis glycosyl transferase WcaI
VPSNQTLRLIVHDFGGYPFIVQLSRAVATRGHDVLHLYAAGFRTARGPMTLGPDDPPSLSLEPLSLPEPLQRNGFRRVAQERRYGNLLGDRIASARVDVVISANAPVEVQATALAAAHRSGAAFVPWVQDLHSIAIRRILSRRFAFIGALVGARFARMEKGMLVGSDAMVAISPTFKPVLREWGVEMDRVEVIENWAPLEKLPEKENPWVLEQGVADRQVVLYAGTLALKHDPAMLLALAHELPDAVVIVVADGPGAGSLRDAGEGLPNLRVLPLQPYERLPEVLASADILVAILEPDASAFSVPSKILTYLASARPIVAAIDRSNAAALAIERAGAGVVVEPTDVQAFVAATRALLRDPERLRSSGAAGRAYATKAFAMGPITDRFEAVLHRAMDRKSHSSR